MRCSKAKKMISEYIDGELTREQEKFLQSHLKACPECHALAQELEAVVRQAKTLPTLSPSPSAWQKISTRIMEAEEKSHHPQKERRGWLWVLLSPAGRPYALATVAALLIIGVGLFIGLRQWGGPGLQAEEGSIEYTMAKLKEAQHHYELAVNALADAVRAQNDGLDPQLAEVFRQNLETIDGTIQVCLTVIKEQPENLAARSFLLSAYREKVAVLNEMMEAKKVSLSKIKGTTL